MTNYMTLDKFLYFPGFSFFPCVHYGFGQAQRFSYLLFESPQKPPKAVSAFLWVRGWLRGLGKLGSKSSSFISLKGIHGHSSELNLKLEAKTCLRITGLHSL